MMCYAFEDLAIAIHLTQLSLCFFVIATMNHQLVNHQADAGANAKPEFSHYGGMHQKPFQVIGMGEVYVALFCNASYLFNFEGNPSRPSLNHGLQGPSIG